MYRFVLYFQAGDLALEPVCFRLGLGGNPFTCKITFLLSELSVYKYSLMFTTRDASFSDSVRTRLAGKPINDT